MTFRLCVSDPYNFFFLRSCFQEFSDDDQDDEAEEENTDDLHKSMTADTDNIFDFISDFFKIPFCIGKETLYVC